MTPKEIKILLLKSDLRQIDIARKLGLKKSTICRVINGKGKSKRVQAYIAVRLGVPYEDLWAA